MNKGQLLDVGKLSLDLLGLLLADLIVVGVLLNEVVD